MLRSKTTFIVGAGASKEVGLPTGSELRSQIKRILDIQKSPEGNLYGDGRVIDAIRSSALFHNDTNFEDNVIDVCRSIRSGMDHALSIDNYIDAQQYNHAVVGVCKIAIAAAIIDAESESVLKDISDFGTVSDKWYQKFFGIVTEEMNTENLEEIFDNVNIITFNYDRCIEHYLEVSLRSYYRIEDKRIHELINNLEIYRPYGKIGNLPWQCIDNSVDYGDRLNVELLGISKNISTFSEQIKNREYIDRIRDCISESQTLVFLGFSYHKSNINILRPVKKTSIKRIFGTTLGMSDYDIDLIRNHMESLSNPIITEPTNACRIETSQSECGAYLSALHRILTA